MDNRESRVTGEQNFLQIMTEVGLTDLSVPSKSATAVSENKIFIFIPSK